MEAVASHTQTRWAPVPPASVAAGPRTIAMTNAEIFRLLDQIAAGLERETQLSDEERETKREEILAWFRPLHARLQAAYVERPCPIPWTLVLQEGVDVPPLPEPHECADCFNAVYAAWKRARGRATIMAPKKSAAA
jgi:hypothetical protein